MNSIIFNINTLLFVILLNIPKFNIISIPGQDQGLRLDDLIVLFYIFRCIKKKCFKKIEKKLLLLITYITLSTVFSLILFDGNDTLRILYLFRVYEYMLFAFCVSASIKNVDVKNVFYTTVIIQAIFIIYEISIGISRPQGSFAGPWEITTVIGIFSLYFFSIHQNITILSLGPLFFFNIITLSKTGLLAVILSYLLSLPSALKSIIVLILICSVLTFFINIEDIPLLNVIFNKGNVDLFFYFIESIKNNNISDNLNYNNIESGAPSLAMRFEIWLNLISLWFYNTEFLIIKYLFGIGLGSVAVNIDGFYVRLFCELGLIGCAIYIYIFLKLVKSSQFKILALYLTVICITLDPYSSSKIAYTIGIIYSHYIIKKKAFKN